MFAYPADSLLGTDALLTYAILISSQPYRMITSPGTTREVIAAVGTRQYYRQRGFAMRVLYRVKELEGTCR
jgi:hypothetical protein